MCVRPLEWNRVEVQFASQVLLTSQNPINKVKSSSIVRKSKQLNILRLYKTSRSDYGYYNFSDVFIMHYAIAKMTQAHTHTLENLMHRQWQWDKCVEMCFYMQ